MGSYAPPEQFIPQLMASTRLMMANSRPDQTLKEVFERRFFPALGLESDSVRSQLDNFYIEIFPSLKSVTQEIPGVKPLISESRRRGYCLVVATNPLFPRQATLERIDWAGLDPADFCLITTYESFHFAKPNPAYYAEILGQLGWPEGPVIMAGNDLTNDIQPAQALGLATFWVNPGVRELEDPRQAAGRLDDLLPWIGQHKAEAFLPEPESIRGNLAVLCSTPAVLRTMLAALPEFCWTRKNSGEEWALSEIACHLRDVDREVNLPRILRVLESDDPFVQGADTDPWAAERQYILQDGPTALEAFINARITILEHVSSLTEEQWQRTARHAIFGPTTLAEMCQIMAAHDRLHIRQISKLLQAEICV